MAMHRWCAHFASYLPSTLIPGETVDSYIIHEKRLKIGTNAITSATRIVLKDEISFTSNQKLKLTLNDMVSEEKTLRNINN